MADVPDVVQNSWGVNENFSGYVDCDSRWWSAIDACEAAGVVVTWSAGNEGPGSQTLRSPADRATTLYNCFSVGSTQYYAPYNISGFSSRGPAGPNCGPAENRVKPEISAPGSDIYSAWPGGSYQYLSGTSMSAPHVAGVVALMRSANPNVDVITIKQVLMDTADDLGNPGEDNTYGHGFLDAYEAVLAVAGGLGYVEGTVEDRGTGDPIEGAVISVDGGFQSDVTEADGSYRLTLPIGSVTINAAAFGYADYSVTVEVEEDLTTNQDLRLDALPSATVTGTVFSAGSVPGSGTPADGAVVEVADTPLASVTTGADGAFSFQLPVGTDYEFRASVSGAGAISQTAPVDADTHLELYLSALTQDGFETGNFNALSWLTNGDANWYVQGAEVHSGAYAARSGDIGNQDNSNLQVTVDCGAGGEVSFWYKVSSEANYDYLEFYVDGSLRAEWAGEVGWAEHTTTVTGGNHTFRWNYDKDWSVSDGQDCGWIDDVTFPGGASPTPLCVPAPWSYAVTLDAAGTITLPLVIMNQGAVALEATATTAGVPWVSIANGAATVAPYTYHAADVIIDADGLAPGDYSAQIDIASNDPREPDGVRGRRADGDRRRHRHRRRAPRLPADGRGPESVQPADVHPLRPAHDRAGDPAPLRRAGPPGADAGGGHPAGRRPSGALGRSRRQRPCVRVRHLLRAAHPGWVAAGEIAGAGPLAAATTPRRPRERATVAAAAVARRHLTAAGRQSPMILTSTRLRRRPSNSP